MSFKDAINELKEFDLNDLDVENIGSWPIAVKTIIWVLVFAGVLFGGYKMVIADLQQEFDRAQKKELDLRKEYEKKAFQAANLDAYRKQMVEMETSFGSLVSQLPSDTEVPGLLEDITNKGTENGLEINTIQLNAERIEEFYVELPIKIVVKGSFHDLGAFVSGISGLPRIVTLHDFTIKKQDTALSMDITAKTYRYKDLGGEG